MEEGDVKVHWFVGNAWVEFTTLVPRKEYDLAKTLKEKDDLIVKKVQKDFENKVGWTIISIED